MTLEMWFWIIWVVCLLFFHMSAYDPNRPLFRWAGGGWVVFILTGILGYAVFGSVVKH